MEIDCKYLFVYGSLLSSGNDFGAYLKSNSRYVGTGYCNGLLYDLGEYPGAVYNPEEQAKIYGTMVQVNSPKVFTRLDEYEGYGPNEPQPNLFIRMIIPVNVNGNTILCWVYLYNLAVTGYPQIVSGKYLP